MSEPHSHIPYGPDGSGTYSDGVPGCYDVINKTIPTVLDALESIPYSRTQGAFTICDYGTADGGTSLFMLTDCIKWIKDHHGQDTQVHVIYEDQPVNDFKSVFKRIHGLLPGPPSYYQKFSDVFVTAAGTSFYSQCVPNNTVHLGFSSAAFHWLSKRPGPLTDAIHHVCSTNPAETRVFAQQAARDWETILLHRAKELKTGGHFIIAGFCVDRDGNYLGKSPNAKYSMYDEMKECWSEMYAEGKITQAEWQDLQFNNYYQAEDEFRAPFLPGTPVYASGLRLLSFKTGLTRCPDQLKWLKDGIKDDPEAAKKYAKSWIPNVRVWSNTTFLSALSDSRPQKQREDLVDEFYQKYEDRVAAAPADHAMDYVLGYLHIIRM